MDSNQEMSSVLRYRAFDVWCRLADGGLARYRCFEVLPLGKFCVQSKDFYRPPFRRESAKDLEEQFWELLSETAPDQRSGMYDSLEDAIEMHDKEFGP